MSNDAKLKRFKKRTHDAYLSYRFRNSILGRATQYYLYSRIQVTIMSNRNIYRFFSFRSSQNSLKTWYNLRRSLGPNLFDWQNVWVSSNFAAPCRTLHKKYCTISTLQNVCCYVLLFDLRFFTNFSECKILLKSTANFDVHHRLRFLHLSNIQAPTFSSTTHFLQPFTF